MKEKDYNMKEFHHVSIEAGNYFDYKKVYKGAVCFATIKFDWIYRITQY
jgi:hypothetical protein